MWKANCSNVSCDQTQRASLYILFALFLNLFTQFFWLSFFPLLPLILWISRSFLTDILWSYHHFLAVFTVIFWLFWVSRFESCPWAFCSKGSPSSIRFSSPIGSSWWILVHLLFLGLSSPIPYFHWCHFFNTFTLWVSFLSLSFNLVCGHRSFLTDLLWSFNPLDLSTLSFSGYSLLKTSHRLFQWLYFLLIGWVFSYSVL